MWKVLRNILGAFVALALVVAAWVIMDVEHDPSYPPPPDALSPTESRLDVERLAAKGRIERSDLNVDLAPATTATAELIVDGQNFFPRILADIQTAQSSVHIAEYGVKPGQLTDMFGPVLQEKARQGVPVRMIVDRFGTSPQWESKALFDGLVTAGVQVVVNDPALIEPEGLLGGDRWLDLRFDELGHLDHRKLFVIDGRIAWVGGAGLEDHFYNGSFHDVMVRVEGDAVAQLQSVFLSSFGWHGGPLPPTPEAFNPYYPTPSAPGAIRTTVSHNVAGEGHLLNTDVIHHLIDTAQSRLDMMSPYNADRNTFEKMMAAARRGVKVRFVVPAVSNNPPTAGALEHYYGAFQEAGVEVWLHPILAHAKVVLSDDRVLVGTTNLDAWALYHNWEIGIFFEDASVAEQFRTKLFEPDIARSTLAVPPTNPLIRLRNWFLAFISPLL
jgi:cardiolipin synthase A/B